MTRLQPNLKCSGPGPKARCRRGQMPPDSVIIGPDSRALGQSAAQREVFLSD